MALSAAGCTARESAAIQAVDAAAPTASPSIASDVILTTDAVPITTPPPEDPVPALVGLTDDADDIPKHSQPHVVTVPILLYHHILADTPPVRYTIAAQRFEQQLDYLIAHGYETITMQDLVDGIQTGEPLPDRPVVLTFDDGNHDLLELAYPRMQARGMIGVVYVVGNRIGVEGFLAAADLQMLRDAGWEIGSHGMTHRALTDLPGEGLAKEVIRSKTAIETALGEPIHSFAYPFGIVTEESLLAVIGAGYVSGVGLGLGNVHRPDGLFYLSRREVRGTYELQAFQALLDAP